MIWKITHFLTPHQTNAHLAMKVLLYYVRGTKWLFGLKGDWIGVYKWCYYSVTDLEFLYIAQETRIQPFM